MMTVVDLSRPEGDRQVAWEAFVQEFGEPKIKPLPPSTSGWRIVRLEIDRGGASAARVALLNKEGTPLPDEPVAFYWADADQDSNCGPAGGVLGEMRSGRCIQVRTKADGAAELAMGHGAYYFAPDIGPHAAWHYGQDQASEVILGLGMLGGTEHWHYNVVFQWTAGDQEDEQPGGDQEDEQPGGDQEDEEEEGATSIPVIDLSRPEGDRQVAWEAFVQEFGEPKIKPLSPSISGWRIVRLEIDRGGASAARVTLLNKEGTPLPDEPVAFYWADADQDSNCGPAGGVLSEMRSGRCIQVRTKADGAAELAMGHGAYYFAPDIGPHAAWHYGQDQASEVILGLGMLGGTEHWHYNVVFQWTGQREGNGGGDENGPDDNGNGGGGGETPVDPIIPGEPGQPCLEAGQVKIRTDLYDVPFPVPVEFRGCPVTGRGVHWGTDWYHRTWLEKNQENDFWTRWARSMHLSWAVVLSASDSALLPHDTAQGRSAIEVLLDAGIIPILRIGSLLDGPYFHADHVETFAKQVEPYKVPAYLLIGNEFGDRREWRGGEVPRDWLERALAWWIPAARTCLQHGIIAGFPDGPDYHHNVFEFMRKLPSLRNDDHERYTTEQDVAEFFGWWKQGKVFYAGHHYGLNRPPNFPDDPASRDGVPMTEEEHRASLKGRPYDWYEKRKLDPSLSIINEQRAAKAWDRPGRSRSSRTACWRSWERVVEWMQADPDLGATMPIAATEGGWTPDAIAGTTPETIDARWPKPIPDTVADYTVQVFDQIEHPMFAQCPWTAADLAMEGPGTWEGDAWYTGTYVPLGYDMDLEVVHALRRTAPRLLTEQFHLSED